MVSPGELQSAMRVIFLPKLVALIANNHKNRVHTREIIADMYPNPFRATAVRRGPPQSCLALVLPARPGSVTPLRQRILEDTAIRNLAENMIAAVESYLAQCRSAGYALSNVEYLLRSFATFAADHQEQHIRTATVVHWAGQTASVAQRHARYQAVEVIFCAAGGGCGNRVYSQFLAR